MTTDNAKSRFTGKNMHNLYGAARLDSPDQMQDSIRMDDVSNKYAFSDELASNQFKTFEQGDVQAKYDLTLKPNLNIPLHQLNRPLDQVNQ